MKNSRFKTIRRTVLRHIVEALVMMGPAFGLSPTVAIEVAGDRTRHYDDAASELDNPYADYMGMERPWAVTGGMSGSAVDIKPFKPLTQAECTEWEALVERLH